jgi:hypothetical protein
MPVLNKTELYNLGAFDNAGRYHLKPEFETETSRRIRTPSRAWPLSVWQHCKTAKFFNSLSDEQRTKAGITTPGA